MSGRRMLGVGLAAALCLGAVWTAGDRYAAGVFCRLTLAAAAAVGLDLTLGLTGQISLCHGAFMGLGAYAAGIFAVRYGPAGLCMGLLCGMGLAALTAGGTGWFVLSLHGDYLAVATLGLGEVLRVVFENLPAGGGVRGLTGIPRTTGPLFCALLLVGVLLLAFRLKQSRWGNFAAAIGADERAALACGIPAHPVKVAAFALSAAVTALAGGLWAGMIGFIAPSDFAFTRSIDLLAAVVAGGPGCILGPALAAAGIEGLHILFQPLGRWQMLLYGVALVLLLRFRAGRRGHGVGRAHPQK